jgi:hypothetical protein
MVPRESQALGSEGAVEWETAEVGEHDLCVERVSLELKRLFNGEVGRDGCGLEIDQAGEELRAKIGTIMDDVWATLSFGVVVPTLSQHESLLPRVASEAARSQ